MFASCEQNVKLGRPMLALRALSGRPATRPL